MEPLRLTAPTSDVEDDSTAHLLRLCAAYFASYVVTGVAVKFFEGSPARGMPGMNGIAFSTYNTVGSMLLCVLLVAAKGWYRLRKTTPGAGLLAWPREYAFVLPAGVCVAVIVPTTTLMYSLPISVMIAMVVMRGSVIVISRAVDAIQIHHGILRRRVLPEENLAVVFALLAIAVVGVSHFSHGGAAAPAPRRGGVELSMSAGAIVLAGYVGAYAIRLYLMNYYKNTRTARAPLDTTGFFGVEQVVAFVTLATLGAAGLIAPRLLGLRDPHLSAFHAALVHPEPFAGWATLAGAAFGLLLFFSLRIFLYRGRSATFTGLVNRLSSLIAGTVATVVFHVKFGGAAPRAADWASLGLIFIAVACLARAEHETHRLAEKSA